MEVLDCLLLYYLQVIDVISMIIENCLLYLLRRNGMAINNNHIRTGIIVLPIY